MKKNTIRQLNQKRNNNNKIVIFIMFIGIIIVCFCIQNKFKSIQTSSTNDIKVTGEKKIYLNNNSEKKKVDYYEDAYEVYKNTSELLKGEKAYPVRTDGKKVVYLTFDDGPSTTNTPEIIKILNKYNVKATFFVLGRAIDSNEASKEILKEINKNGHSIGNHTYSHDYGYLYPNRIISTPNVISDIEKCNNSIKKVLGQDFNTRIVRFPGGYWSWNGREGIKKEMDIKGYCEIDWNVINGDAENHNYNSSQLLNNVKQYTEKLGPNADSIVVLMHDTYRKEETVKALSKVIEYYRSMGFEFKAIK